MPPVDRATTYARAVAHGGRTTNRLVRLACERHLRDLEEGPSRGLEWRPDLANRVIECFSEILMLSHVDPPVFFKPEDSQAFILGSLFGWTLKSDGSRRFRVGFVEQAKGSGKTPLAAAIGVYMMAMDGEPRAEVYSAAVDKDQAMILFRDAVDMVRRSPGLSNRLEFSGGAGREWNLYHQASGSFFRPISSEAQGRGKSGPRVHCAVLDEVHEHKTSAMVEFMRAGTKGRKQALVLLITNSGSDRQSVCYHYHEYSERVLKGLEQNDAFFAYVCGLDSCDRHWEQGHSQPVDDCGDCDDWREPTVWGKANPLLDVSISRRYLEEQVREALGMPSKQNIVKRLNFCIWTETAEAWISADVWFANGETFDRRDLKGRECYGGLDLSGKNDLTALILEFPLDDGTVAVLPMCWTPAETLREREELDRAPYAQWVREGHLTATPGRTIGYDWVAKALGDVAAAYDLRSVSFDPWRIDDLKRELDRAGVEVNLVPHGQGFKDMDAALEALEDDLLENLLRHGNHPVLTAASANAAIEESPAGLRRFAKQRSRGRIDPVVALAMASSARRRKLSVQEPEYQMFFVGR